MDPRQKADAQLEAYRAKHADAVTPEMFAQWGTWIDGAAAFLRDANGEETFGEVEKGEVRWGLSQKHISGEGIEVGALHNPLRVPDGAQVTYVDKYAPEELALAYYEIANFKFVDVDVIDDGEKLGSFADASHDFLISNHFLEHCQDPIGTLLAHARVLRPGGVLYCAVPDARKTFDSVRERTPFEHVRRDHVEGPAGSREAHYQDWSRTVNQRAGDEHEAWWRLLDALDYSIHFHVWDPGDAKELYARCREEFGLPLELRDFVEHADECVAILERV